MFRSSFVVSIFLVAATSSTALAGSPTEPPGALRLSLADAVAMAETRSPDVLVARSETDVARARRVGAGIIMPANPRLSLEARPALASTPSPALGYASILDFMFDFGGAPGARVREADAHLGVARADLSREMREARVRAWRAYLRARAGEERVDRISASIEIADRVLRATRQRSSLGAAGDSEEMLAETDRAELGASLEKARADEARALMDLRDELDLPPERAMVLTTALENPPDVAPASVLLAHALRGRPELATLRTRMALLDATYERLGKETFPKIGVYAGIDAAPDSPIFGMLGLSVELPVVQRNQNARAITNAMRDEESQKLGIEARRIARDVLAARATYESRRVELDIVTSTALPAAERALELIETGWKSGRFDVFRVTAAARDVARVRALRVDALEAVWMARLDLDRAVGGLTP